MRAESFCYACAGILLLVAAWTMGARNAEAEFVPGFGHAIGMWGSDAGTPLFVRDDGTIWRLNNGRWRQCDVCGVNKLPPVPASDIAFWALDVVISTNGDAWTPTGPGGSWVNGGPIPPPPTVGVESSTMSDVKGKFRDERDE